MELLRLWFLWFGIVWCWRSISCFRLLASLPYMSINAGIETAVGAVMGVGPKWVIFLTNVGTNLVMNIILGYLDFTFRLYVRGYYFPVMCVFEILVLAAEYRIYLRFMGRRFPKKSILKYTAAANAVSFLLGLLALQLLGMGVF